MYNIIKTTRFWNILIFIIFKFLRCNQGDRKKKTTRMDQPPPYDEAIHYPTPPGQGKYQKFT